MATALLDEVSRGAPRERAESWRYSRAALRGLEQTEYVDAARDLAPSAELASRFDWDETAAHRQLCINGGDADQTIELGDGDVLHRVHLGLGGAQPSRWRQRTRLIVRGGSAELIEHFLGEGGAVLGESSLDVELGAGAKLALRTLTDLPDDAALIRRESFTLGEGAQLATTRVVLGGRFQRFDHEVALAAPSSRLIERGVFALRGRAHADVHLRVRHVARDATCDITWRGVADQRARGILHGAIEVAPGADGADARLQTKNLLLSPHAEIDAQPVLEIHADEVKAAHGATVGQLDERALFYLRSRGLPLAVARALLIAGFCREAFEGVPPTLRARLEALLALRMPQAAEGATP